MIYSNTKTNELGHLTFCGRDVTCLAAKYGTPAYIMDEGRIVDRIRTYKNALEKYYPEGSMPLYASKALSLKAIYRIAAREGIGIDVVSSGEIFTATEANFPMERAFFHGNNKTEADIKFAMDNGVGFFVCDNFAELEKIGKEAIARNTTQNILLRLTPGIDPHTHAKISTGQVDSKFGAAIETGQAEELTKTALETNGVSLKGFHCHIGSQIFEITPFVDAGEVMLNFIADIKEKYNYEAEYLNLGGGFGVRYIESDPQMMFAESIEKVSLHVKELCKNLGINLPKILMEPGRSIVADSGITLYTVGGLKEIPNFRNYVSVDGGMADNARYTLYQSPYTVINATKATEPETYECTVAGRCCESGDLVAEGAMIARPDVGDIIAVLTTGAYNYSMASNYNSFAKPPIVMLSENREYLAAKRETFEDMIKAQL